MPKLRMLAGAAALAMAAFAVAAPPAAADRYRYMTHTISIEAEYVNH